MFRFCRNHKLELLPGVRERISFIPLSGHTGSFLRVLIILIMSRFCRNHTLELLPGISHWVQQEAHEAVNKHIEAFIKINP